MYSNLFSTYEATDAPPIITERYRNTKEFFDNITQPKQNKEQTEEQNLWSKVIFPKSIQKSIQKPVQKSTYKPTMEKTTNKKDQIIQYFVNKGLTVNQARGIYGNIMQESGGNISIVSGDGYNSYGIAQWTGPRKVALFNKYGTSPTLQQQLDFIWEELNTTHKSALAGLRNSNTIEEATRVFMDRFERPNKKYANFERRLRYATT